MGKATTISFYAGGFKPVIDRFAAAALLLLLSPVFAIIALLQLVLAGRPILFRQQRPGFNERPFFLLKYRTMAGNPSLAEDDEARLTRFGAFLRKTSLDELPELWHVLRGEMSLVGPRPLLMEYLALYTPAQARRHLVRPGITGWAQVNGRNSLSWEQKFQLDTWYVDHVTFALDAKILIMTVSQVSRGRGVSAPEHATMPKFRGSKSG